MLEDRIGRATELAVERLTEGMETVELGQIRHRDFSPVLVRRLTVSADRLLEEEQARRASSPMNYEHPRVKPLVERLDAELRDTVTFSREEIAQLVEDQIRWEVLLRLRPVDVIPKLIFSKRTTLSFRYILKALSSFDLGSPYVDAVEAASEDTLNRRIGRGALTAVLQKAEDQVLEDGVTTWVMDRAASVMEVLRQRKIAEGDEVDLDVLEQILRYRELEDLERLIRVQRLLGRETWTFGQARQILEILEHGEDEEGEVLKEPEGDLFIDLWEVGTFGDEQDRGMEKGEAVYASDQEEEVPASTSPPGPPLQEAPEEAKKKAA